MGKTSREPCSTALNEHAKPIVLSSCRMVQCRIDNVRWDVDASIQRYGGYEEACDALGLPHYIPLACIPVDEGCGMHEIKEYTLAMLTRTHGFEAIDAEVLVSCFRGAWND